MYICIRATESSAPLQALGVLARLAWRNWLDLTFDPHLALNSRPQIVFVLDDCPILTITLFSNFTPYSLWTCRPKLCVYHMISNLIEQIMIKITNKGKCPSYLFIAFARSWIGESCEAVDVEVSWLFLPLPHSLQALHPSPRWPRNMLVADLFTKIVWSWQRDETTFKAFVERKYASANTLSKHGKYSHRITQCLWKPSLLLWPMIIANAAGSFSTDGLAAASLIFLRKTNWDLCSRQKIASPN